MSTPIAVVVPCRDRGSMLRAALAAVSEAMRPGDECVVADSASRGEDVAAVAAQAGAGVVRLETPGAGLARNAGVRATGAPILAFTDDDCRPDPGWLDALEVAFAGDPSLGFVAGLVVPDDGTRAMALSVTTSPAPRTFGPRSDPMDVGHGANLAVRREAFEAVGGFDPRFGPGALFPAGDDTLLISSLLRAGWTGRYEPAAAVVHVQWRTRRESLRTYYRYGVADGGVIASVARDDPRAARRLLVRRLGSGGLARIPGALVAGHELAVLAEVVKAAGLARGLVRGAVSRPRPR